MSSTGFNRNRTPSSTASIQTTSPTFLKTHDMCFFFSLQTLLGEDGLMSPNATIAAESAKVRREAEAN